MKNVFFIQTDSVDPYENLARESYLVQLCARTGCAALYIWQNEPTVVVGRNQNVYAQCCLSYADAHNIHIARRRTGGGAVYHDPGCLLFSIILPRELHDPDRSGAMIVDALRACGIPADKSGRNDICVHGGKLSGSAYYTGGSAGLHHGTILLRADRDTMDRVLTVSPLKAAAHGVSSVRARITDVASCAPHVTKSDLQSAVYTAFCREYGFDAPKELQIPAHLLREDAARLRTDAWIYGRASAAASAKQARFSWGTARVALHANGTVTLETDALNAALARQLQRALSRCVLQTPPQGVPAAQAYLPQTENDEDRTFVRDVTGLFLQLWDATTAERQNLQKRSTTECGTTNSLT